jgi:hypothetical protein
MEAPASWSAYVAACESACCVVGTDGNILAANGALAARVGCDPAQLQAEPLTSLLATGQPLPPQFEEVLRCGVQGVVVSRHPVALRRRRARGGPRLADV